MKINTPASRDKIRARYGSVREFARQCVTDYGLADVDAAYSLVGKTLMEQRGTSRRGSIAKVIRMRLESEGLLVLTSDTDEAANG